MLQRGAALAEVYKEKLCSLFRGKFWIGMQFTVLTIEESNAERECFWEISIRNCKIFFPLSLPNAIKQ